MRFTRARVATLLGVLLGMIVTSNSSFLTGLGSWTAAVSATQTYHFIVTVQNHPSAQNATAAATFNWEAQV